MTRRITLLSKLPTTLAEDGYTYCKSATVTLGDFDGCWWCETCETDICEHVIAAKAYCWRVTRIDEVEG